MESEQNVAARRRVLLDTLVLCLGRSKVAGAVSVETLRSVLESGMGEMWREGELRLESVWKLLCNQPGLSPREVAPPLLVYKAMESALGVHVRLPGALAAIPAADQARIRGELGVSSEELSAGIERSKAILAEEERERRSAKLEDVATEAATQEHVPTMAAPAAVTATARWKKPAAIVLGSLAALSLAAAAWITFKPPASVPLTEFSSAILLTEGRREGETFVARLNDPRWETLKPEEQHRAAARAFDIAWQKGFRMMTLYDGERRMRVTAWQTAAGRQVNVQ